MERVSDECLEITAKADDQFGMMARELIELRKQCAWQPIETAPKDGTEILAWHLDGKNWHQVAWKEHRKAFGMRWNAEYSQVEYCFSHWMPLPKAPA